MGSRRWSTGAMAHVLERLGFAHLGDRLHRALAADLPAFLADFHTYFPLLQAFARAERVHACRFAEGVSEQS